MLLADFPVHVHQATGELLYSLAEKDHLAVAYTCLAWGTSPFAVSCHVALVSVLVCAEKAQQRTLQTTCERGLAPRLLACVARQPPNTLT